MRNLRILLLIVPLLVSCGKRSNGNREQSRQAQFKLFLRNFKELTLPFKANTSCYYPDSTTSIRLDQANDTLFLGKGMHTSVGILPDTSDFYVLIYCGAAACWLPQLAVYSKGGDLLSEDQISNGCGSDCGYSCSDSLVINSITNIVVTFKSESFDCDSLSRETPGTRQRIVKISNYSIDRSGKIKRADRDFD